MGSRTPPPAAAPRERLAQVVGHLDRPPNDETSVSSEEGVLPPLNQAPAVAHTVSSSSGPSLILIFGWTAGPVSALARYAALYNGIFPAARVLLFPSTPTDLLPWPVRSVQYTRRGFDDLRAALDSTSDSSSNILVHAFSGGGTIRFASLAALYYRETGHKLPIGLLMCDSGPTDGGVLFRALTLHNSVVFANSTPLVRLSMLPVTILGLLAAHAWTRATWQTDPAAFHWEALLDPNLVPDSAIRGYIYSTADLVIGWEGIEKHVALAKGRNLRVRAENFEDSGHVSHAKKYPERYWTIIKDLWRIAESG